MAAQRRAIVLLSGGIDSATVLALARRDGYDVNTLAVRYGQRNACELVAARAVAAAQNVERHLEAAVTLDRFGASSLTADIAVPKADDFATRNADPVPSTYVPARNTVLLSLALAWAEALDADAIFVGVHATDRGGYPDCRPQFVTQFERLAAVATNRGVEGRAIAVRAPLLSMGLDKGGTVRLGLSLGVDYAPTWTCFDPAPGDEACGHCDACLLRRKGFADAGAIDPARYARLNSVAP